MRPFYRATRRRGSHGAQAGGPQSGRGTSSPAGPGGGKSGTVEPCGRWEPLVASGPQRPAWPGVPLGGFHKPRQGQAWATGLPQGPGQEELAADVSPCANLWLPASGAVHPPACQGGSLGPGGPGGPTAWTWPVWTDCLAAMALGPQGLVLESGEGAGWGWSVCGDLSGPRLGW